MFYAKNILNKAIFKGLLLPFTLFFLVFSQNINAQGEFNNWYFGYNAGVTFASGAPVALTNGALSTAEGCATISDAAGNLLFYTDGITVYNKNHVMMTNGNALNGNPSSAQSAIIVPWPGKQNVYFIFTVDAQAGAKGACYSIVDMSLSGGLGAVTTKNVFLYKTCRESLTAVPHSNGCDIWVITHKWISNEFYAYLVSSTGVATTPVISATGRMNGGAGPISSAIGYLRANRQGTKLAMAEVEGTTKNSLELFDFNSTTGVVSNAIALNTTMNQTYSCEFSPNGNLLYGSSGIINQFDISSGVQATINATRTVIGNGTYGALQLGPDNKMYQVVPNVATLHVINNPNTAGVGCNFVANAVSLSGRRGFLGLPTFITSWVESAPGTIVVADTCEGDFTQFSLSDTAGLLSIEWNFGDPPSGVLDSSTSYFPTHQYSSAGTFTVTAIIHHRCKDDTLYRPVKIIPPLGPLSVNPTDAKCFGESSGLASVNTGTISSSFSYVWNNGQTTQTATGLSVGNYSVVITDANGCLDTLSTIISQPAVLTASTSSTPSLCFAGSSGSATVTANGGTNPYTYSWNVAQSGITATGLTAGSYTATVVDNNGCTTTAQATVSQPASAVTATISAQTDVTCNGANDGTATASASGGTPTYTYSWNNGQTGSTATGLAPGVYTITATDSNGCVGYAYATISEPPLLTVSVTTTSVSCVGGTNGTANANSSGGTSPYTYVWINSIGSTITSVTSLPAGNYTVVVTDNNGCSTNATATISQPSSVLGIALNGTNTSCFAGSDGSISANLSGGSSPFTYSWSNGQTGATATGLTSGTYSVTVSDNNGCTNQASLAITSPPLLTASITASTDVACNGGNDGAASVTANGGTPAYTYTWNSGSNSSSASSLGAGTYTATVTDNKGCSVDATVTITEPPALSLTLTPTDLSCNGNNSGSILSNISGGTSAYTYNWSTGSSNTSISGLAAGNYSLTVTDNNGCTIASSSILAEPTLLNVSLSSTPDHCSLGDGTAAVTSTSGGTPAYTYSWSSGSTSATVSNLSAGTYTLTLTDNNSCTLLQSVVVNSQASDTLEVFGINNVSCNGACDGDATLQQSGSLNPPYSYSWNTIPAQTTLSATGLCAGVYTCTMTDEVGCASTKQITVTQPTPLTATISAYTDVLCNSSTTGDATVLAGGGTTAYTYNWSNGQNTATASNLGAGTYTVTVTDNNSCTTQATVTITEPTALSLTLTPTDLTCNANNSGSMSSNISGGVSAYTYNWSNGSTNSSITSIAAGNYSLTVTDANGCTIQSSSTITEPPVLTMTLSSTDDHCFQSDGTATVNASGGTLAYTYNWMPGGQNSVTASNLATGTYSMTLTDNNGCSLTNTILVDIFYSDTLQFVSSQNNTCNNSCDGSATLQLSGAANGPYTYNWSVPGGQTSLTATSLCAGVFTCTMTDGLGCKDTMSVSITEPAILTTSLSSANTLCFGDNTGGASSITSGGTQAYTYNWSNGGAAQNISGIPSGLYSLTVTDANGCTASGNTQVNDAPQLLVSITPPNAICFGQTANLSGGANGGTPGYSYLWSTGQNTASITTNTLGINTGYTVTATDANGCSAADTATITVNPLPVPSFTTDATEGCEPLCVNFSNTTINSQSQVWNFGDGNIDNTSNPYHCYTDTGKFDVTVYVIDNNGCSDSATIANYITVYPKPVASFTMSPQPTTILNPIIYFRDQSWQASTWSWTFGDVANSSSTEQNPFYTYSDTGSYLVQLIIENQYGCLDTIQDSVIIGPDFILFIPNTFTPNGDGLNETFKPEGIGFEIEEYEFWIFDRWGNLIFKTNDPNKGWDGRANGGSDVAQQDTYVWKIATKDYLGLRHRYVGHVNLIR